MCGSDALTANRLVMPNWTSAMSAWASVESGDLIAPDSTDAHALMAEVQFGITNRFAVSASLPHMTVRFAGGPHPHLVNIHGQPSSLDNGQYHGTTQDFHFGGQWSGVQSRRLIVTPFAEAIIPSHDYESLGQSVVGR